jgi:hypothetical protein
MQFIKQHKNIALKHVYSYSIIVIYILNTIIFPKSTIWSYFISSSTRTTYKSIDKLFPGTYVPIYPSKKIKRYQQLYVLIHG